MNEVGAFLGRQNLECSLIGKFFVTSLKNLSFKLVNFEVSLSEFSEPVKKMKSFKFKKKNYYQISLYINL